MAHTPQITIAIHAFMEHNTFHDTFYYYLDLKLNRIGHFQTSIVVHCSKIVNLGFRHHIIQLTFIDIDAKK